MYSNLRTVAGESNHILLPHTLDISGAQRELVYIISSDDIHLQRLHDEDYALPMTEFAEYLYRFPKSQVIYQYRGKVWNYPNSSGTDGLVLPPISILGQKLFSFRVVDLQPAKRCQPVFSPAR